MARDEKNIISECRDRGEGNDEDWGGELGLGRENMPLHIPLPMTISSGDTHRVLSMHEDKWYEAKDLSNKIACSSNLYLRSNLS